MKIQEIVAVGGFFVLYTGLLFGGFSWMLKAQTKQITGQIEQIKTQIDPINEKLGNHITDTK